MDAKKERGKQLLNAINDDKDEVAVKLLKEDVDFLEEQKGDNAIHMAARKGKFDLIKMMKVKGVKLQQKNMNGNTALHYAARGGYTDIVRYLHSNKVDMNIQNKEGDTALHMAVIMQPMDVIEQLIKLGMDPNKGNSQTGETPLHTALKSDRQEAMEGLLIGKARANVNDKHGRKPEDVAKTAAIRESIRMYAALLIAMQSGYIQAKGMKITRDMAKPQTIDRVDVVLESCDIPAEFPTGFYCRREQPENATVTLKHHDEEHVFSDVFYFRLSDVNKDCAVKINLPLYMAPSDKEQMVLRFINSADEDRLINTYTTKKNRHYCLLETTLVPETTCVCLVYVRPKLEENAVSEFSKVVTSEMAADFSLDIPAGAFEKTSVLNLRVFETNSEDFIDDDVSATDDWTEPNDVNNARTDECSGSSGSLSPGRRARTSLLTDIYQINITGQQPSKGIMVQIPLCMGCDNVEDVAILSVDETKLQLDNQLEIVTMQPKLVNCNLLLFEASHFSIYVAAPKKTVATPDELSILQRQISSARDKRKPATFFAVVKQIAGFTHNIVVDCGVANKSLDRMDKWTNMEYEKQHPDESEAIMVTPGDEFFVDVMGNARLECQEDSTQRKLCFTKCRASIQAYNITLDENVTRDEDGFGWVVINRKIDNGLKEVARLGIKLHVPPPSLSSIRGVKTTDNRYKTPDVSKTSYKTLKNLFGIK